MYIQSLHSAHTVIHRNVSGGNTAQLYSLAIGQGVHSLEANVEATRGGIDGKDIDGFVDLAVGVVQLVAFAAVRAVPGRNGNGTSDVGEVWQRTKVAVSERDQAMFSV
jgi:hypothetical protein